MVRAIAYCLTAWIFVGNARRKARKRIISFLYGLPVWRRAKCVGKSLRCKGPVHVTRHTELGDHVHFNGAFFYGGGTVTIGSWFHSGEGLKIFTRNHNYEGGDSIRQYLCT